MALSAKVFQNVLAQIGGKIAGTVLGLAAVAIMTRYLGSAGFGEYTTVITFASIFAIVADLGLTLVTSQLINRPQADEQKLLDNLFGFRLVSALVIIGLAPLAVWLFPYSAAIKSGVVIISFSFLCLSFNQIFVGLFQKALATQKIAVAETVSRALLVAAVAWAAWQDSGLTGMLWAMVAANLLNFALHYYLAQKIIKIRFAFDLVVWREIAERSWPLLLTIVLNLIYLKADIIFLSLMKSQGEVGLYGAAYKVVDVLVTFPFILAGLILPLWIKHWLSGERAEFDRLTQQVFNITVMTILPLAVGGLLLARPIMNAVAGVEFVPSGDILRILLAAVAAVFFSCLFSYLLISLERQKQLIKYYLITALTAVPVYFYLIKKYSYFGAAWGTVYSESLILLFTAIAAWRALHFWPQFKVVGKVVAASALMAGFIWLTRVWSSSHWGLVAVMFLAAALYLAVLLATRAISGAEVRMLFKK